MTTRLATLSAALLFIFALAARAEASSITVLGSANIFAAGEASTAGHDPDGGGPGTLPPFIDVVAGQMLSFSVTGSVSCCSGFAGTFNGPDGGSAASGTTDVLSFSGISGMINNSATMFLVGVFTDGTDYDGAAPARLDFTGGMNFSSLSPLLFQSFFIGDGLTGTGTGSLQTFVAPAGATRLYFGFVDSFNFGNPTDEPGWYNDNVGSLEVSIVPEPATLTLVGLGAAALLRRRRASRRDVEV